MGFWWVWSQCEDTLAGVYWKSVPQTYMASIRSMGARGSQGKASKLSQLVKSATEGQEQRPVSSVSWTEIQQSGLNGSARSRGAGHGQAAARDEDEATFYSVEDDSEDDEDEL